MGRLIDASSKEKKSQTGPRAPSELKGKAILITGGTGSFGKKCIEILLRDHAPSKVIVFSRDELKQHEMRDNGFNQDQMRYFIGDIRDRDRLCRAMNGIDYVIHAAALKQVPSCEYNPIEAINTNVMGTRNVIDAALDAKVTKVIALSTDKAVNPINLYGATKLCAEKLIVNSNSYSGKNGTRFACVRYGNVVGSRGSVIPIFQRQRSNGTVTVTDDRMSRFWITLEQGVQFVLTSFPQMQGGEVFVPKIPSMKILDLVHAVAPQAKVNIIGIRPGEKLHEILVGEDEARHTVEMADRYVVEPVNPGWRYIPLDQGRNKIESGFTYTSDNNPAWLGINELRSFLDSPTEPVQHFA